MQGMNYKICGSVLASSSLYQTPRLAWAMVDAKASSILLSNGFQFGRPAECGSCTQQPPFRCRDGDPECFGGFNGGALLQVMKVDNIPKCWSQLRDCVSQGCLLLGSCANLLWIWHRVARFDRVCGVLHPNFPLFRLGCGCQCTVRGRPTSPFVDVR